MVFPSFSLESHDSKWKYLLVLWRDRAYLHASHQGFDNGQLQPGLYGQWTV